MRFLLGIFISNCLMHYCGSLQGCGSQKPETLVHFANVKPELALFLSQYVHEKVSKPKGMWVLVVRFEGLNQNQMYLCLISKRELCYLIKDDSLIPNGVNYIGNVEVIYFNVSNSHSVILSDKIDQLSWYKHARVIDDLGKELEPNVEPYIDVFELNGNAAKSIGYVVKNPVSPVLSKITIEKK